MPENFAGDRPDARPAHPDAHREWRLVRNCALTPRQLGRVFGGNCVIGLAIAVAAVLAGYWVIAVFVAVEMTGLAVAMLCYARHAGDGDRIVLQGGRLTIERRFGSRTDRHDFPAHWVRVAATRGGHGLLVIAHGRQALPLGRQAPPGARRTVAMELRAALREPEHVRVH